MPKRERLAAIAFGLKLAITLGLFAYLLRKVEFAPVLGQLRAMSPAAVAGAELLLVLQLGLLALRWYIVNRIVQAPMQVTQVLRLTAIGHFFNQVLPSGFAGDAARAWLAAREGVRLGPAVRAIACDRVIGLLVLVLMVSIALFAVPDVAADNVPGKSTFRLVALLGGGILTALFLLGAPAARLLMRHPLTESPGRLTHDLHGVSLDLDVGVDRDDRWFDLLHQRREIGRRRAVRQRGRGRRHGVGGVVVGEGGAGVTGTTPDDGCREHSRDRNGRPASPGGRRRRLLQSVARSVSTW